jgi:hypothetical protein
MTESTKLATKFATKINKAFFEVIDKRDWWTWFLGHAA